MNQVPDLRKRVEQQEAIIGQQVNGVLQSTYGLAKALFHEGFKSLFESRVGFEKPVGLLISEDEVEELSLLCIDAAKKFSVLANDDACKYGPQLELEMKDALRAQNTSTIRTKN